MVLRPKKTRKRRATPARKPAAAKSPHPSAEVAERVQKYAGAGLPQLQAAQIEGIDVKTLRKHYKREWNQGFIHANVNVGVSLYNQAVGRPAEIDPQTRRKVRDELKPDRSVSIFLGKVRLGMKEPTKTKQIVVTQIDLTVFTEEEFELFSMLYLKALNRRDQEEGGGDG